MIVTDILKKEKFFRLEFANQRINMKILYVNGKNNNGGANIALLNIVKGMLQKGHEVHVITDNHPGFFLGEIKKTACTLHL